MVYKYNISLIIVSLVGDIALFMFGIWLLFAYSSIVFATIVLPFCLLSVAITAYCIVTKREGLYGKSVKGDTSML